MNPTRQEAIAAAAAKIAARTVVDPKTGCVRFTGSLRRGYGQVRVRGESAPRAAHRVMAEHVFGPLPDGLVLDHLCHAREACEGGQQCPHRSCVNPEHLELVEQSVNVSRGWIARKPECGQGHLRTPENMWVSPTTGERECRICRRAWNSAQRDKRALRAAGVAA